MKIADVGFRVENLDFRVLGLRYDSGACTPNPDGAGCPEKSRVRFGWILIFLGGDSEAKEILQVLLEDCTLNPKPLNPKPGLLPLILTLLHDPSILKYHTSQGIRYPGSSRIFSIYCITPNF